MSARFTTNAVDSSSVVAERCQQVAAVGCFPQRFYPSPWIYFRALLSCRIRCENGMSSSSIADKLCIVCAVVVNNHPGFDRIRRSDSQRILSHLQIVALSLTQTMTLPSRLKVVWRTAAVHFGWVNTVHLRGKINIRVNITAFGRDILPCAF